MRERFAALSPEKQETRRAAFSGRLKRTNAILHRQFKKDEFESWLVAAQFSSELRETLLSSPEETSMEAYRAHLAGAAETSPAEFALA